ncbi:hypothetical protein ACFTWF_32405 [Rhodococcus sp. NPDC056960]|uniref:hypothetical protein n=1 Tax=Rhodococcus sp. NPDC056960 TaxID=3345982 RepID=UPI00362E2E84
MSKVETLADLLKVASARHNGASGRRLAEIAIADGHDVSHATLNRIRQGKYSSRPTENTIRAIAYLAGVPEETAFMIAGSQAPARRTFEEVFVEWQQHMGKAMLLTFEYARMRGIDGATADEELREAMHMSGQMKDGRPWTPPWQASKYGEGEEPWRESWWREQQPVRQGGRGAEGLRELLRAKKGEDDKEQEPRTEESSTKQLGAGGSKESSGAPMNVTDVQDEYSITNNQRLRPDYLAAREGYEPADSGSARPKESDVEDDTGQQSDYALARREGETEERRRRRIEGEPWNHADPEGPETGA